MSILVAGHYCHDTLLSNAGEHRSLGGSAAYAAAILEALDAEYEVVAKVGRDFLYGAQVTRAPRTVDSPTTRFVDDYRFGERRGRAEAVCEPIFPQDLRGNHAVGIACAIAGEIPLPTLARLRGICRIVVADAQSLLREIGPGGEVLLRAPAAESLEHIDYLKASRAEAAWLDLPALRRRITVIVTDGARGCTLLTTEAGVNIPPFPANEVDPTGAGDCFLAGFAVGLSRDLGALRAARVGAWCGARAVEQVGVPRLTPAQARAALEAAG